MRLLVTGGAGFIGSHFAKRLAGGGDEVVVLDKLTYSGNLENLAGVDCQFVQGDIADADAVAQCGRSCDAVVNFAAESHVDRSILGPAEFIQTDVFGTHVLLEWARETGSRFVQVSTDEVYGDLPEGVSSKEDDPLRPSSPYAASKAGGDLQVLAAVRTYGVNASITRGSNTYGRTSTRRRSSRSSSRTRSTASRCRSTATAARFATGSMSRITAPASSSCCRRARRARSTTWAAATSMRTSTWRSGSSS